MSGIGPDLATFKAQFEKLTGFKPNAFHPLVWVLGEPKIGKNVGIGGLSEINASGGASIEIGDDCDIASFVSINTADSHRKCLGLADKVDRQDIVIGHNVFIGAHSLIRGGARIGHHCVVAAGTIVGPGEYPPYSLLIGNPMQCKAGYYGPDGKGRKAAT